MTDETQNRVPVTSRRARRAAAANPAPNNEAGATAVPATPKPDAALSEGDVRRAEQAEHKDQAKQENLLAPGKLKEREPAPQPVAKFGGESPRKAAQAQHRQKAEAEAVALAGVGENVLEGVKPGEQPTLLQLRQLSKINAQQVRDEATEAGRAAGKAVRDILIGRKVRKTPHERHSNVAKAQDALQKAGANARG